MSFLGDLFGGGEKTETKTTTNGPWQPQQQPLQQGFNAAQGIAADRYDQGGYQGNFYAPATDEQHSAAAGLYNYAMGAGSNAAQTTAQTGVALQQGAQPYMNNAANIAATGIQGPNQGAMNTLLNTATGAQPIQSGISSGLSSALQDAAVRGANSLNGAQGTLQNVQQRAQQDPTQGTISAANQYANNPVLQQQIDAANATTARTLNESTLPGLNRQASLGGNLNSSRAGMGEAMANRDAAAQMAATEATMRGQAYNNGLQLSEQQRQAGMAAATGAANSSGQMGSNMAQGVGSLQQQQGQFGTTTQLGAANSALNSQLGFAGTDASTRLAGNQQLGSGVTAGVNAAQSGAAQNILNGQASFMGAGVNQQDNQGQLNDAFQQWQMQNGYDQNVLNDYMKTVGGSYGKSETQTGAGREPGNVAGGIGGALTAAATPLTKGGSFFDGSSMLGAGFNAIKGLFG